MKKTFEWATAALVGLVLAMVLRVFVVEGYKISGDSMLPTFQNGDFVFAEKLTQKFSELEIGDIVILKTDTGGEQKIIKRVVGLAGDTISIKNGFLYRNGEIVTEGYIKEEIFGDYEEIVVPQGEIFVLGDNRNNSSDSRYFGTFTHDEIKGRVAVEILNDPLHFY